MGSTLEVNPSPVTVRSLFEALPVKGYQRFGFEYGLVLLELFAGGEGPQEAAETLDVARLLKDFADTGDLFLGEAERGQHGRLRDRTRIGREGRTVGRTVQYSTLPGHRTSHVSDDHNPRSALSRISRISAHIGSRETYSDGLKRLKRLKRFSHRRHRQSNGSQGLRYTLCNRSEQCRQ